MKDGQTDLIDVVADPAVRVVTYCVVQFSLCCLPLCTCQFPCVCVYIVFNDVCCVRVCVSVCACTLCVCFETCDTCVQ
jgi:hypothetical protein